VQLSKVLLKTSRNLSGTIGMFFAFISKRLSFCLIHWFF